MPGLSKVIVLDPDARASRQVQLGFEREGVPTAAIPAGGPLELGDDAGLVVVGGVDGAALDLVRQVRGALDDRELDAPIVFAGRGVRRGDAQAAGADEVVLQPAYLRDVVTIGRLLRGLPAVQRSHLMGSLVEITGVYTLIRALAAIGRSATLTLIRGLRRGEVRFYHGEVTSAQVGMIHGQAALHQLLLWTDARFDFHHEDVVRRQQIPLTRDELFADAERFLEGVRESSGGLSPSIVLEPNLPRVHALGKQIPTEVYGVLRMFDGHRVLADVLEDSAYRVFETLRVAQLAVEAELLRVVDHHQPRATWRTVLAIEDWLVGAGGPNATAGTREAERDAAGKPRKQRGVAALASPRPGDRATRPIDWGALVPRVVGAEVGPLAQVVPAAHVSGEIDAGSRAVVDQPVELPPTVVFDAADLVRVGPSAEAVAAEATGPTKPYDARGVEPAELFAATAEPPPAHPPDTIAAALHEAIAHAAQHPAADPQAAEPDADADATPTAALPVRRKRPATQQAAVDAPAADDEAPEQAREPGPVAGSAAPHGEPEHVVDEMGLDDTKPERLLAQRQAAAAAAPPSPADSPGAGSERIGTPGVAIADSSTATVVVRDVISVEAPGGTTARITAIPEATVVVHGVAVEVSDATTARFAGAPRPEGREGPEGPEGPEGWDRWDSRDNQTAQFAGALPPDATEMTIAAPPFELVLSGAVTARGAAVPPPEPATTRFAAVAPPEATTEPFDAVAPPEPTTEQFSVPAPETTTERFAAVAAPADAVLPDTALIDSAPTSIVDEPSDGVIRQHITTAETEPVKRLRAPSDAFEDDRPGDATGEITLQKFRLRSEPRTSEPSILVADMAAFHDAVSAIADDQPTTPVVADAASRAREAPVIQARRDAVAFSEVEEAFFRAGHDKDTAPAAPPRAESFDDLDEDYRPLGFWDRLRGRTRRPTDDATHKRPAKPAAAGPGRRPTTERSTVHANAARRIPATPSKPRKK